MNRQNTVALITGASRGLGLAIARAYAARGIQLILTARGAHDLQLAATGLPDALAVPGDVADRAHVERLVSAGLERFGHIDVLINNASELGPSPMQPLAELSPGQFEDILRVNVVAPLQLIQAVLPHMRAQRSGLIVNVTSDAAVQAYPTWGGYGASKAALEQLSRVLAEELEGTGLRVYVVDPGDMDTAMHRAAEPGVDLSHLPGPEVVAPVFVQLLDETAPTGRFEAQRMLISV
ncbi:MAG: SDR family oxidoreductase [Chloroflexi bacterium]|nr:SDR family oxidoreductase [Chloroflexota bacterium]MBV9544184.1 SDR family oxidoreductase [Chloroflexota bacterium]